MKRIFGILLTAALLLSASSSALALSESLVSGTQLHSAAKLSAREEQLFRCVSAKLSQEKVEDAYQRVVLFDPNTVTSVTDASLLPVARSGQTELRAGFSVRVLGEGAFLQIYTTASVLRRDAEESEENPDAPAGEQSAEAAVGTISRRLFRSEEEPAVSSSGQSVRELHYETKKVFLSEGTAFFVQQSDGGLLLSCRHGSITVASATDPFDFSPLGVRFRNGYVNADASNLTAGVSGEATGVLNLSGEGKFLSVTEEEGASVSLSGGVVFPRSDGEKRLWNRGEGDALLEKESVAPFFSVCAAANENSAILSAFSAFVGKQGSELELYTKRFAQQARQSVSRKAPDFSSSVLLSAGVQRMTSQRYQSLLGGEVSGAFEEGACAFTLPASNAAYTVSSVERGRTPSGDTSLSFVLTLTAPFSKGDVLDLQTDVPTVPVSCTAQSETVFACALVAPAGTEKLSVGILYQPAGARLFFPASTAEYRFDPEETVVPVKSGEAVTFSVKLARAFEEQRDFFSVYCGEEKLTPTASGGEENTYYFSVVPGEGANLISILYQSLYRVTVKDLLREDYTVELPDCLLSEVPSGSVFALQFVRGSATKTQPLVLQKCGDSITPLHANEAHRVLCAAIGGDTELTLSLGFPITLPESTELYAVRPEEGFSESFAQAGEDYRFSVVLAETAAPGTSLLVKNNGITVRPNEKGVYVLPAISEPPHITVAYGVAYNISLPMGTSFAVHPYGGDGTTVLANGSFRFTLELTQNALASQVIVAANATVLTPNSNGIYTISQITQDIAVTVRLITSFRVVLPVGDLYTVMPYAESTTTVLSGGSFRFTVQVADTVSEGSVLSVKANEEPLIAQDGVYSVDDIQGDIYITVSVRMAYAVTLPQASAQYTVAAEKETALYGDSYSFTVLPRGGASLTVKANGKALTGANGVYTIAKVYSDLYITVEVGQRLEEYAVTVSTSSTPAGIGSARLLTGDSVVQGGTVVLLVETAASIGSSAPRVEASGGTLALAQRSVNQSTACFLYTVSNVSGRVQINVRMPDSAAG